MEIAKRKASLSKFMCWAVAKIQQHPEGALELEEMPKCGEKAWLKSDG